MDEIERERHRLAQRLEQEVIGQLSLLLTQANAYETALATHPQSRMAFAVITSMIAQTLQRAQDLQANLYPTTLETLGLEPALDYLANQQQRRSAVDISLDTPRLKERLPTDVERIIFRAAQELIEYVTNYCGASHISLMLKTDQKRVTLICTDDGTKPPDMLLLRGLRERIQQADGKLNISDTVGHRITLEVTIPERISLTAREREIIQLLADGLSNKEIAARLTISTRTVNFHLDNIYSKLNVNTRTEAVVYALRQGWIQED